tara:strand:- start:2430 stop:3731 length:1302 start_codon:yes stop_codon:yes gene_type:complete
MSDKEEIERALLWWLMNRPNSYYDQHQLLKKELFSSVHRIAIFEWIDNQYQNGDKFDMLKCMTELGNLKVKGVDYELGLCMTHGDAYTQNIGTIIEYLTNVFKKKNIKRLCEEVLMNIDDKEVEATISKIETIMTSINSESKEGIVEMTDRLRDVIKMIEKNAASEGLSGIPSGFANIDKFTGGWQPQDLIIIGGASSMGKTSFSLSLAYNASAMNYPTVIFSYEMSVNQLMARLVSAESEVDNKYILKGTLTSEEWSSIHSSTGVIERTDLYIDECANTSLRYLLNRIRQYVVTKKVKLVMVDYLQLVSCPSKGSSREQEIAKIARALKNIAKELDITILALSQLSRGVERNEASRPMLSNLRESGEIEQAADAVILVYRPEYYGFTEDQEGNNTEGLAEIIFAKGRNIGVGSKWLKFIGYLTKFVEIEDKF